jgi:hypothetical protein
MKHLKSSVIIAILNLCLASSHHVFASSVEPVSGIDVIVKCLNCKPPVKTARVTAPINADGTLSVQIPSPGKWDIIYAEGPKEGKVITTVTAQKAGPVKISDTHR